MVCKISIISLLNALISLLSRSLSPVGEFGWDSAANAFAWIDTENRIAAFYGCHVQKCSFGSRVVHPTLRNLVYEGLQAEE